MSAISGITNGEILSSVRTKLNEVITNVNLLDPTDWVDYSSTSTVVGWSSLPTRIIKYRVIGKQVFYIVNLSGTSNSTSTSFTLAHTSIRQADVIGYGINNGAAVNCLAETPVASSTTTCYSNLAGWTGSGTKSVWVQFFIDIA